VLAATRVADAGERDAGAERQILDFEISQSVLLTNNLSNGECDYV